MLCLLICLKCLSLAGIGVQLVTCQGMSSTAALGLSATISLKPLVYDCVTVRVFKPLAFMLETLVEICSKLLIIKLVPKSCQANDNKIH